MSADTRYNVNVEVFQRNRIVAEEGLDKGALMANIDVHFNVMRSDGRSYWRPVLTMPWYLPNADAGKELLRFAPGVIQAFSDPFAAAGVSPSDRSGNDRGSGADKMLSVYYAGFKDISWTEMMAVEDALDTGLIAMFKRLRAIAVERGAQQGQTAPPPMPVPHDVAVPTPTAADEDTANAQVAAATAAAG